MIQLEYVASGCNWISLIHSRFGEHMRDYVNSWIEDIKSIPNSQFSLLYNAYTEKKFAPILTKNHKRAISALYADSGGLQVITRGQPITPEFKMEVYKNQAKYCDFAMCFDEIPLIINAQPDEDGIERSTIGDLKGRRFDKDNLKRAAATTGRNVNEQINYFRSVDSKAKPIVILQGKDYDTFSIWAEELLKEIPLENQKFIGPVAISSASIGNGELEEVRKYAIYRFLPFAEISQHIHLLGVGSLSRMYPLFRIINGGLLPIKKMSYDSTTHTSQVSFGRMYMEGETYSFDRNFSKLYEKMYAKIEKRQPLGYNVHDFHESLNMSIMLYSKKYGDAGINKTMKSFNAATFMSIYDYQSEIHSLVSNKKKVENALGPKHGIYDALDQTKTLADYLAWEKKCGYLLKSMPVEMPHRTIDELLNY